MNTLEVVIAENDVFLLAALSLGIWGMRALAAKGSFGQSQARTRARKGEQPPEVPAAPAPGDSPEKTAGVLPRELLPLEREDGGEGKEAA